METVGYLLLTEKHSRLPFGFMRVQHSSAVVGNREILLRNSWRNLTPGRQVEEVTHVGSSTKGDLK